MQLKAIIISIFLIFGAIWFAFFYYFDIPQPSQATFRNGVNSQETKQRAFLLPVSETSYFPARDFSVPEPEVEANAAALFDVSSSKLLYSNNIHKRLPIASITKLMTAIVVVDNLDLEKIYTVPAESVNVDGLGAIIYKGEQIKGRDLLKIMLIKSSNDAALTFSAEAQKEGINLVERMNQEAQKFGMYNTKFTDTAGLDDYESFSTAFDLIKLVMYASDFDFITETLRTVFADITSENGRNIHLINTNQLLNQMQDIIFGKTGYTDNALGTMVLKVNINNSKNQVISIILGSQDRFGETKKLIEWGKKAYNWK